MAKTLCMMMLPMGRASWILDGEYAKDLTNNYGAKWQVGQETVDGGQLLWTFAAWQKQREDNRLRYEAWNKVHKIKHKIEQVTNG